MSDDEQHHQHDFEQASAGASATFPMQCSALRKNGHVVMKGNEPCRPCKIVEMSTSKTGKHGHAKVHLVGIDVRSLFIRVCSALPDSSLDLYRQKTCTCSHSTQWLVDLVNIDDGFLNLMTQDGTAKDDVKLPDSELGKQIQDDFDEGKDLLVTIVTAMGEEQAISYKEAPKGS
ncbi:hypothetical protein EIP86_006285 [Pleurotus ostreatoroseus]|nr:hypothetical protein EIP86_006285 [Pleurotus ostreatoroseus]